MFNRRLLINGIGGDSGLLVKIKVINDTNGSPIPLAKVYVEGGTSSIQTTNTAGEVEWRGFKTEDVGKSFVVRVADSGTETCLNYTNSFQLRGLINETWIVPLSNINNSAKCYLLHEKTLAPVNDATIQIVDQSTTPVGVPDMVTVDGLAEWSGLVLDPGEYSFYYSDPDVEPGEIPITAISKPFDAILSAIQVVRYMFINPPLEGITVGEKPSGGVLGYSSGYYSGEPDQFGGIRPNKLQLTPSVQAEIDAVVLQQDQCTIVIDTVQMNENFMNAILTFKMAGLPDMLFAYAFNEMQYYIYTCASPDITEQWLTYWGANIGNTLPFELTSSLNIAGLTVGVNGGYYGFSDGSVSGTGGMYGKIEPNPITISGKTGQIKCLYMAGRNVVVMQIKWNGSGFPNNLRVEISHDNDIIMSYVDFQDDIAIYEYMDDPDVIDLFYNELKLNVGYTIKCIISNPDIELPTEPPIEILGVINVPAEGSTPVPFTFTVPQNITVLEAITASQGTTVKDYIGVTAGKTYTWSVALTYTPPQPVVRGLWQLKNGSGSVLVQIVKYIGSNLVGSGASVLSYSEAINKISPTITDY